VFLRVLELVLISAIFIVFASQVFWPLWAKTAKEIGLDLTVAGREKTK